MSVGPPGNWTKGCRTQYGWLPVPPDSGNCKTSVHIQELEDGSTRIRLVACKDIPAMTLLGLVPQAALAPPWKLVATTDGSYLPPTQAHAFAGGAGVVWTLQRAGQTISLLTVIHPLPGCTGNNVAEVMAAKVAVAFAQLARFVGEAFLGTTQGPPLQGIYHCTYSLLLAKRVAGKRRTQHDTSPPSLAHTDQEI